MIEYMDTRKERSTVKVALSDNFCEQTHRDCGTSGFFCRFDKTDPTIGMIDIGEKLPVRVHVLDFVFIS